ncbi:E1-E2 ATPase-domain-containing protein, partial [Protomyces lactucae-debilis]
ERVLFVVQGMDCAGCAASVDAVVKRIPGVASNTVNYTTCQLTVDYEGHLLSGAALQKAIEAAGYKCSVATESQEEMLRSLGKADEVKEFQRNFFFSLVLSIPVIFISTILPLFGKNGLQFEITPRLFLFDLVLLILTTPLQFYCARRFYQFTWSALRRFETNADTLITLGMSVSYLYSIFAMATAKPHKRPETLFETSAELVTFVLFGRWLEASATGSTTEAMAALVKLAPDTAVVVRNEREVTVPVDALTVGDIIVLHPGTIVPADAIVISGQGDFDESMLTGESIPRPKQKDDLVVAGTRNLNGSIVCKVKFAGQMTQLQQIIKLVSDAQTGEKANVQSLADRVAAIFTPCVVILSLITFIAWYVMDPTRYLHKSRGHFYDSLRFAIAVIVASCPCALVVATPAAVMVGTGKAASLGILIKGAPVLEHMTQVTDIIFDKTRTLTTGEFTLSEAKFITPMSQVEQLELWRAVAAAESASGAVHPLGAAILAHVAKLSSETLPMVQEFEYLPGRGIACKIQDRLLKVGNHLLLGLPAIEGNTDTNVLVSVDSQHVLSIGLKDQLRPGAQQVVAKLQEARQVWILTGDEEACAAPIAKSLGISPDHLYAQCSLQDKARFVTDLQAQGRRCLMMGDGVNDCLALSEAHVAVSMHGPGTQVAVDSADVVILGQDADSAILVKLVHALALAEATLARIKLNLVLAFGWNLLALPLAMGLLVPITGAAVYLPPGLAGGLMAMSCVGIITSSLMLQRWQPP